MIPTTVLKAGKRLRLGVFGTGDELVEVAEPAVQIAPGDLVDFVSYQQLQG